MNDQPVSMLIEALLLFKGTSMSRRELQKALDISADALTAGLAHLRIALEERGIRLIEVHDEVSLATAPEADALISAVRKEELEGPLGKATLETLAVIVYQGPITRSDIEFIRGVNVTASLRTLMMRGLIERVDNPSDQRSFLYRGTIELAAHLGVTSLADVPEYVTIREKLMAVSNLSKETT